MLSKLQSGVILLRQAEKEKTSRKKSILDAVKTRCQDTSVREFAGLAGVDYTSLTRALTGKREPSATLLNKLKAYLTTLNDLPCVV